MAEDLVSHTHTHAHKHTTATIYIFLIYLGLLEFKHQHNFWTDLMSMWQLIRSRLMAKPVSLKLQLVLSYS